MRATAMWLVVPAFVALVACAPSSTVAPGSDATCEQAFRRWVNGAAALNSPGVDLVQNLRDQETIQRRVFELCTLEEAERLNVQIPLELAPGLSKPVIEPDVRTFASVECVDESPLLDGTQLCAEVGR